MCGIFAITGTPQAAELSYLGLFALQHRGQESAGIVSMQKGQVYFHRGAGLVSDVFDEQTLLPLKGNAAIGHVRYSTAGGFDPANTQPLFIRSALGNVALAHNGNIVNASHLREELERQGAILQGTADTEVILHLIARSPQRPFEEKLKFSLKQLVGAYSIVCMTESHLYAVVDPLGFRPLALGKIGDSQWVFASESCAFDLIGAQFVRDVEPGELITVDRHTGQLSSHMMVDDANSPVTQRCSFEHIYFARPDSRLWNESSLLLRENLGVALANELPVEADAVIAVPDSGVPMAMGYSRASGLIFSQGFIRNHYVGRTFIEPNQNSRNFRVRLKLNPVRAAIEGKRLVVVDDSIVRGTTSRKIVQLLRDAGAKEIHLRIGSPEVRYSCFYGIDTPRRQELLAPRMSLAEMASYLGVDTLAFLSLDTLKKVVGRGFCTSCFSGKYSDALAQERGHLSETDLAKTCGEAFL